jgi:hypothetical protein
VPSAPAAFHSIARDPRVRELLLWCLPALVLGLVLRVMLTVQMPYAFYHDDAPDFFSTPDYLFHKTEFRLHPKKTFLTPILFTIPFALPVPAMVSIPVLQHLLGLALVVLIGVLCRLWFRGWKWFIVPLTTLTAANPFLLWYEHTIMAETQFIVCTLLLALAGTLYALQQSRGRFIFLCVMLFLEAGARPEGKLLFGFALALLLFLHFRELRPMWPRFAALVVLGIATHFMTKTSQAGLLLYTSVVRLTPPDLKVAPGFDPYIARLRADLQKRWAEKPSFPKVRDRRAVAAAVERYLKDHPQPEQKRVRHAVNAFCMKLATETCRRNAIGLPELAYHKFRYVATESPAGLLDNAWLFNKQREAYVGSLEMVMRLSQGLLGRTISSEAEMHQFIESHYAEVQWLSTFSASWLAVVNALRLPDTIYPDPVRPRHPFIYPGVPWYFLLAALGLIAVALRPEKLQAFHIAWGLTLLGFFFTIMITANVRPRFRFVFEPFWFIYIALLLETLWLACIAPFRRRST